MAHQSSANVGETLTGILARRAQSEPDRTFIVDRDTAVSFAALDEQSRRIAHALRDLGVRPGDRVAIWLPNVTAWLASFFACLRLGAIAVSLNTRFRSSEVGDIIKRSGVKVLIFWPRFEGVDLQGTLADADPELLAGLETIVVYHENERGNATDIRASARVCKYKELATAPILDADFGSEEAGCIIFTTSGTTRAPKFVLHSQSTLLRHAYDVASNWGLDAPGSSILLNLPFVGVFGFCQFTAAFVAGATIVTAPIFKAEESVRFIAAYGITHMGASDMMVDRLLAAAEGPRPFPSVRFCAYAAFSPSLEDIASRADARGLTLTAVYGSSELQALFARQPETAPLEHRVEKGGMPVSSGARVRVRDAETGRLLAHGEQGELEIQGQSRMIGYFENPEATAVAMTDDGFFRTGDLGLTHPDGRFAFLARLGDSLRLGGYLVSPAEIEAVVQEHPSVEECQVVGVQAGGDWRVFAFVIGKPGQSVEESEVIGHCGRRLSKSKVPVRVHQIDAFPVTESANSTKIQKGKLRELAQRMVG